MTHVGGLRAFGLGLILAGLVPATGRAGVINLGVANAFNVFSLGDDTQSGTDAQGRVAVGGNANFGGSGYTVASNRPGGSAVNLVVGGNYSNTYNTVNGSVAVGGNATINGPTINGNLAAAGSVTLSGYGSINGSVTYGTGYTNPNTTVASGAAQGSTTLPVDFGAARTYLTSLSTALANAASTGTATFTGNAATNTMGQITLTGTGTTSNVFHIRGADLALAYGLAITAPAGSTVVIDVDGAVDRMASFGFSYSGVDNQHVLFNFGAATSLTFSAIGIQGSVLAPLAALNFAGGNIDGTLVAGSISGGGESHDYAFQGDLSPIVGPNFNPTAVPEPASAAMALLGLGLAGLAARRRSA